MKTFALIAILFSGSQAIAQTQCRQEFNGLVCRDRYGSVVYTCEERFGETICKDRQGNVISRCREWMGAMRCQ